MNEKLMSVLAAVGVILWLAPVVNLLIIAFCYAMGVPCWSVTADQAVASVAWPVLWGLVVMGLTP
jgi:hypothetical protein